MRQCREFLTTVDSDLSPCLPSRTGWDVLDTAFSAVKTHVREIIFSAAEDRLKQWTFKGYVKLVKIVFELIELAGELGVASDVLQDLEADLQVRTAPSLAVSVLRSMPLRPLIVVAFCHTLKRGQV